MQSNKPTTSALHHTSINDEVIQVELADQIDQAVFQLFGHDSPTSRNVCDITQKLRDDLTRIHHGQNVGPTTIALVGKVGAGKSWLARAMIPESSSTRDVLTMIHSGQNHADRSMQLRWIGPSNRGIPTSDGEQFIQLSESDMLNLGGPYILGDSPGFSDHDPRLGALSSAALLSAKIKILVVPHDTIRGSELTQFVQSMNGSIVLPAIRFRADREQTDAPDEVRSDCAAEIENWKTAAPETTFLDPIYIPDAGIVGDTKALTSARERLTAALSPYVENPDTLAQHREAQIQQQFQQARRDIAQSLQLFYARLEPSISELDRLESTLKTTIQDEIIGNRAQLNIGIRSRFRADAIERTPALLFPYKSLMGILGLTQGAWDRLVFTTLGSVPSLVMTAFHTVKSWSKTRDFESSLRQQASDRIHSLINDAYREELTRFSRAITSATEHAPATDASPPAPTSIGKLHLSGLTGLEIESQSIVHRAVQQSRISGFTLVLGGLLSFIIFWAMLLGPAIALYTDYFSALNETASSFSQHWDQYPKPPASLWLTSFMLSLIPAGIIAMLVMYFTCKKSRVSKTAESIASVIGNEIEKRIDQGNIQLTITDPKLDAARFLLSLKKLDH